MKKLIKLARTKIFVDFFTETAALEIIIDTDPRRICEFYTKHGKFFFSYLIF